MSNQRRASMQESYLRTLLKEEKDAVAKPDEEDEEEAQYHDPQHERPFNNQHVEQANQPNQGTHHQEDFGQYQPNSNTNRMPDDQRQQNTSGYRTKMNMYEQIDELFEATNTVIG